MHAFPSPSPSPSPSAPAYPSSLSDGHADRDSHSLSGSVMTCCHRSLWGRQECWCFRLALKGVERALPVLLRPLLPTAPFSVRIGTVCLSFSLFLLLLISSTSHILWAKAFSVCLTIFPAALLTAQHLWKTSVVWVHICCICLQFGVKEAVLG